MAERARMTQREIIIGVVVLLVVFLVVFFGAGALNLGIPQWVLAAVAAVVGVIIWFGAIGRWKR